MATVTITGRLGKDPEVVHVGSTSVTKLVVFENTGEWRKGAYTEHPTPTTHYIEAKFELGANAAAALHTGDAVIVVGRDRTDSWQADGQTRYGRVITADAIGRDLRWPRKTDTRTQDDAVADSGREDPAPQA